MTDAPVADADRPAVHRDPRQTLNVRVRQRQRSLYQASHVEPPRVDVDGMRWPVLVIEKGRGLSERRATQGSADMATRHRHLPGLRVESRLGCPEAQESSSRGWCT